MATKADLLGEIDTNLNVVDKEQVGLRELTSGVTRYDYNVVYKEGGLVVSQGFHIAVENEGQAGEAAYFMERQPEWRRTQPDRTDIGEDELRTFINDNTSIDLRGLRVNNQQDFARVTLYQYDSGNDQVVETVYAVNRDGSGGFTYKVLKETSTV